LPAAHQLSLGHGTHALVPSALTINEIDPSAQASPSSTSTSDSLSKNAAADEVDEVLGTDGSFTHCSALLDPIAEILPNGHASMPEPGQKKFAGQGTHTDTWFEPSFNNTVDLSQVGSDANSNDSASSSMNLPGIRVAEELPGVAGAAADGAVRHTVVPTAARGQSDTKSFWHAKLAGHTTHAVDGVVPTVREALPLGQAGALTAARRAPAASTPAKTHMAAASITESLGMAIY